MAEWDWIGFLGWMGREDSRAAEGKPAGRTREATRLVPHACWLLQSRGSYNRLQPPPGRTCYLSLTSAGWRLRRCHAGGCRSKSGQPHTAVLGGGATATAADGYVLYQLP